MFTRFSLPISGSLKIVLPGEWALEDRLPEQHTGVGERYIYIYIYIYIIWYIILIMILIIYNKYNIMSYYVISCRIISFPLLLCGAEALWKVLVFRGRQYEQFESQSISVLPFRRSGYLRFDLEQSTPLFPDWARKDGELEACGPLYMYIYIYIYICCYTHTYTCVYTHMCIYIYI